MRMRPRRSQNSFRRKVINALSDYQNIAYGYGSEFNVVHNSDNSPACVYFTCESSAPGDDTLTKDTVATVELCDPLHLAQIANYIYNDFWSNSTITPSISAPNNRLVSAFNRILTKAKLTYTLRNQSTETAYLSAFYCRARGNVNWDVTETNNIYRYLSQGFANKGLDKSHTIPSQNAAMTQLDVNPFESFDFCRNFKITKVKRLKIDPSEQVRLSLKRRPFLWRPADYFQVDPGLGTGPWSWTSAHKRYNIFKFGTFILFKLESRPAGYGAAQANYTKYIQTTTPTVVLYSRFLYSSKMVPTMANQNAIAFNIGFGYDGTHGPAIVVPDGDVIGEEKDAS